MAQEATIATHRRQQQIQLRHHRERRLQTVSWPMSIKSVDAYQVSMGIYVLEPAALKGVMPGTYP